MDKQILIINDFNKLNEIVDSTFDFNLKDIDFLSTREFESSCSFIAKSINLSSFNIDDISSFINEYINKNTLVDKMRAFTFLFSFATKFRRLKKLGAYDLVRKFRFAFSDIPMYEFLFLLAKYSEVNDSSSLKSIISDTKLLLDNSILKDEIGVKNFYCELIATYYERELDSRNNVEAIISLKDALKLINEVINTKQGTSYDKFYVTRGRILVLLKRYDEGEYEIRRGLSMLDNNDIEKVNRTILYESYLIQANSIRHFDLSNDKYKELDKIKVNNLKIITLITTLLGFLLGSINIFSYISDPFLMGMLLIAYVGLLLILCGTLLLGFGLIFKDVKKKYVTYDICILVVGIIILSISLVCLSLIK